MLYTVLHDQVNRIHTMRLFVLDGAAEVGAYLDDASYEEMLPPEKWAIAYLILSTFKHILYMKCCWIARLYFK